jgi:glycosyltransferase involved in cell wall biosynthesis
MARINVIIPTYNVAHYLPEAIESVLVQPYNDLEIIVIDDGSTDNTKVVVTPYLNWIIFVSERD